MDDSLQYCIEIKFLYFDISFEEFVPSATYFFSIPEVVDYDYFL